MPTPDREGADGLLPVRLNLEDPDRDAPGDPVAKIVGGHLASRDRSAGDAPPPPAHDLWEPSFFGLDRVGLFAEASQSLQDEIMDGCARSVLNEAYFIEKSGMAYCAKMILLSDSSRLQQVYGLIAADEATHLEWVRPYVAEADRGKPAGAMLEFLSGLIGRCDQNTLAYLVQVILEGWGLHHYRALASSCRHAGLRTVFQGIHRDEALHHHTGEVVFDAGMVSGEQEALVEESLRTYAELVRVGPQAVVGVLDRAFGGLGRARREQVFAELETEARSAEKLALLRGLMAGPGRERFVGKLDAAGAFIPHSPGACAAVAPG